MLAFAFRNTLSWLKRIKMLIELGLQNRSIGRMLVERSHLSIIEITRLQISNLVLGQVLTE